jgi:valyl-tRNA synthetase
LKLNETIESVSKNLEDYQFSTAGEILQQFTWNDFADWYLEVAKVEKDKDEILLYVLQNILKLWHPFCPFVTENIWNNLGAKDMLIVSPWPEFLTEKDEEIFSDFQSIQDIIGSIRNLRGENKIEPAKMLNVTFVTKKNKDLIEDQIEVIKKLARIKKLTILESSRKLENTISTVVSGVEIYIDLAGIINIDAEKERLNKEIAEAEKYVSSIKGKLSNKQFIANAPKEVVDGEKEKSKNYQDKIAKLRDQLNNLK